MTEQYTIEKEAEYERRICVNTIFPISDELYTFIKLYPGVEDASRYRYHISIFHGKLFETEEVITALDTAIKEYIREGT